MPMDISDELYSEWLDRIEGFCRSSNETIPLLKALGVTQLQKPDSMEYISCPISALDSHYNLSTKRRLEQSQLGVGDCIALMDYLIQESEKAVEYGGIEQYVRKR